MRVEDLSGENAAAYRSVAEAEVGVGTPHLHHIAHEAGPNLDWVPAAVQRLLHSVPKISSGHRPDQLPVLLRQLGEDVVELPGRDRFPHRGQDGGGSGPGLVQSDVPPFRDPTNELVHPRTPPPLCPGGTPLPAGLSGHADARGPRRVPEVAGPHAATRPPRRFPSSGPREGRYGWPVLWR
jgi:hypothetical protein